MEKIIVAVDLSDVATVVLDHTVKYARAFKCHVHILHVEVPLPSYVGNEIVQPVLPTENEEEMSRVRMELSSMVDYLKEREVEVDYELVQGPIVETIIEKAASYNADLIILGAHNHGFLYRAFIGSVCTGVVKNSPCPVLIVPSK